MAETTKTSSQPKLASSRSPSPPNAGNTDPSASTSTSAPTPTPTLGGILPELKAHVLDYLPYETVEVALPMLDPEAEKDRGKVDNANASNRGGDADASKKKSPQHHQRHSARWVVDLQVSERQGGQLPLVPARLR